MKLFLKKVFLFTLPVLVFFGVLEWLLRRIPNDYAFKSSMYQDHGKEFETLILGNSYAMYDLDPSYFTRKTFNGAHIVQPLDRDAAIFFKYEPLLTNLKHVIIPISDMSFFSTLENSDLSWRIANYSIYYKLRSSTNISDYFEIFHLPFSINRNRLIAYYLRHESAVRVTSLGFGNNYQSANKLDLASTALESTRIHKVKDFSHLEEEKKALTSIVAHCDKNNIQVLLLIPPAYKDYVARIDSLQLAITLKTCQYFEDNFKNVKFINLMQDSSFHDEDYFDAVHLNEIGAARLSKKIDGMLK